MLSGVCYSPKDYTYSIKSFWTPLTTEMNMTDFNPTFETIGGLRITLTEICHDAGLSARITGNGDDAYLPAYYATMKKLCPAHPADAPCPQ